VALKVSFKQYRLIQQHENLYGNVSEVSWLVASATQWYE